MPTQDSPFESPPTSEAPSSKPGVKDPEPAIDSDALVGGDELVTVIYRGPSDRLAAMHGEQLVEMPVHEQVRIPRALLEHLQEVLPGHAIEPVPAPAE